MTVSGVAGEAPPRKPRYTPRQNQIVRAAGLLFRDRGYHRVHMQDIAAEVGISGPALYRHFRNKGDILSGAISEQLEQIACAAREAAARDDADEAVAYFVSRCFDLAVDESQASVWVRESRHLSGAAAERFHGELRALGVQMSDLIGRVRPELSAEAAYFLGWSVLAIFESIGTYSTSLSHSEFEKSMHQVAQIVVLAPIRDLGLHQAPTPVGMSLRSARRERILEAATALFNESGFDDVSMEDIAQRSNNVIATIYSYFENKADLLKATLIRGAEGLQFMVSQALGSVSESETPLLALTRCYVEVALGPNRGLLNSLLVNLANLDEGDRDAILRVERDFVADWVGLVAAANPDWSPATCVVRTHATISIVNAIAQSERFRGYVGANDAVLEICIAVLTGF